MTRTLLLTVHIVGVAAWLGANLVQIVLTPRFAAAGSAAASAWTAQTEWLGRRYYNLAGAAIVGTGVLLVLDGPWSWGAGFVWVGIATVVVGGVLGVAVFGPLAVRRQAALDAGDADSTRATLRTTLAMACVDTALVVVAVLAMVHKFAA